MGDSFQGEVVAQKSPAVGKALRCASMGDWDVTGGDRFECSEAGRSGERRAASGVFRLECGNGGEDEEQRALLERAGVDEQVKWERIELGERSERWSGDCGLYCSAVTNEMRMGVDREDSGAARRVRWLRKRNDGVTFLKMANGRIETSRSSRAPSKGVRRQERRRGRGRQWQRRQPRRQSGRWSRCPRRRR